MKMVKKENSGVAFASKEDYSYDGKDYEADLKDGDEVVILDGGKEEEGNYGKQINFVIQTRNGEKKLSFNQTTVNVLIQELGDESVEWINKKVRVILQKKVIAGKKVIIPYLVVGEWEIDSWGELSKSKTNSKSNESTSEEINTSDLDTINASI